MIDERLLGDGPVPHTPASLRVARGLTQAELAEITGVGSASIRRLERDGGVGMIQPRFGTVEKISKGLDIEPETYTRAMRRLRERTMPKSRKGRKAGTR